MDTPFLPPRGALTLPSAPPLAPTPLPWNPKYQPEQCVYTDGSDIKGQPRLLGAAVVHVPTCTTLYIDARGKEETRTIMRAELVAIYTALDKFCTHKWVGIFTNSRSSLHAIRHRYTHQGPSNPHNYHHRMLLLSGVTNLLEEQQRRGFQNTLHKIRAHTNIRDIDLADAAAKMAVTHYDSLPESQRLRVEIGEVPPRPTHWVMYTVRPPLPPTHMGADTRMATLRQPWWSIPEGKRLQMHAFTRPSQQLRRKVKHALLHILHYTSLYRRLIQKNIEMGTNTRYVGMQSTADSRLTLGRAPPFSSPYTVNCITASSRSDTAPVTRELLKNPIWALELLKSWIYCI